MPDESDDHEDGAEDAPVDSPDDGVSDATTDSTTDAAADGTDAADPDDASSADEASDSDPTLDTESDATPEDTADDADTERDGADESGGADDADAERDGADEDGDESDGPEPADDGDDGSGGLERMDDDGDDGSGGLERVDDDADEGEPIVAGEEGVPNRGVEAGFDRPEDAPEKRRPDHPDKRDGDVPSDVPVGHAAGAPSPGEATPAGAGAGAGAGTGAGAGGGAGRTIEDDEELFEGPPDDEEMPLADHIEEMMLRLAAVVFAGAAATVLMYLFADFFVSEMWNDILPAGTDAARPHLYAPLEFVLTKIKVASLAGIIIALPVLVYQSYLFMRPGLYPQERRYYIAAVPTSLVLAVVGMAFAYFAVLPGLFQYFDYYTEGNAVIAYGLQSTFNLIVALMGLQAVVFQIPLFVMLAIMMGVTSRQWLEGRRLLFWGAFGGIAFLFAPDPTGMAPFIIAISMIVLFEGTLALLRWTGR
jgi:sec-independent protein translocase protein TatC